jgi:histidinol-phosphate/aromatic aminotransferase/cobyric acid decarboxylase-like protein
VRLARGAPDSLVVVDEIYAAFTGQSVVPAALALDNVVALRSLSKTAGLAALRLGFAVGHPSVLDASRGWLKQRGVLVRSMAGKPVIGGSFRLTVGPLAHMQQFMAAFGDVLG